MGVPEGQKFKKIYAAYKVTGCMDILWNYTLSMIIVLVAHFEPFATISSE